MALLGSDTSVTGPFPKGVLLLETLVGREMLGQPYLFELGLLSRDPSFDADVVLGKPLAVGLRLGSGGFRYFHGIVTSLARMGVTHRHVRFAVTLEPAFMQLACAAECRVFNEASQTALGIVTAVLAERGLTALESGAVADHAFRARELCVQYRETDLAFAQRLLEEEGIYYFFRHEEAKHAMVLADSIAAHEAVPGYETVPYAPKERRVLGAEEHFWAMRPRQGLYPGRHTVLSGYDPTKPRPRQPGFGEARSTQPAPGSQFEHYDYPGGLHAPDEASREATVRSQADHAEQHAHRGPGQHHGPRRRRPGHHPPGLGRRRGLPLLATRGLRQAAPCRRGELPPEHRPVRDGRRWPATTSRSARPTSSSMRGRSTGRSGR